MTREVLRRMRSQFVGLAGGYAERLGERREHIVLKRDHSLRVHALAARIVAGEGLAPALPYLAASLLHDIGRFPQFERFGTYRDDESVDHGDEGASFLDESGLLDCFAGRERDCIVQAVRMHNKREIPEGMDPLARSICDVVRDADKLDIVPVVLSKMQAAGPRDPVVTLGLADEPTAWTPSVLETVAAGGNPSYKDLRCMNDFALLLASWGPVLVHRSSRRIFAGRGYLDRLFVLLPSDPGIGALRADLARRLAA
ncbi:HD domain-containing protein [Desulfomicrobium escambiense]|uniref:HD domain-containing protein n=1 Tax=Desulfomicrobium escambiense TaxID=29503 RepID=UPI00041E6196|nr:HD domain-containing protein [Desulfomicrobium escambiense]